MENGVEKKPKPTNQKSQKNPSHQNLLIFINSNEMLLTFFLQVWQFLLLII